MVTESMGRVEAFVSLEMELREDRSTVTKVLAGHSMETKVVEDK